MAQENEVGDALLGAVAGVGGAVGAAVGALFRADAALDKTLGSTQGAGARFEVQKDTVLASGKIINDQLALLKLAYRDAYAKLRVTLDGADEVNEGIAIAWNSRLVDADDSYSERIEMYITSLTNLVEQLRTSAEQYGFNDEEISASLGVRA